MDRARRVSGVCRADVAVPAALALGWGGWQSALQPAGPEALQAHELLVVSAIISAVVWVLVVAAMLYGVFRRRVDVGDAPMPEQTEPRTTVAVSSAVGVTVVVLFGWLVLSHGAGIAATLPAGVHPMEIDVTGHQWWWEVQYPDTLTPALNVTTANEIHIPLHREVMLRLASADVIHSLFIPNLMGKRDLIPGLTTSIRLRADSAGTYRAQCAEFCGMQHANMALFVIAEPAEQYSVWLQAQRQPARPPTDSVTLLGEHVFTDGPCAMCHAIRGTSAYATNGPDLTHVASRLTIGAGTLNTSRGSLAGWITDPGGVKPGVQMPPNTFAPESLQALVTYLASLR